MLAPSPDCVYECEPWNVCDGVGRLTARTHPSGRMEGKSLRKGRALNQGGYLGLFIFLFYPWSPVERDFPSRYTGRAEASGLLEAFSHGEHI